MRLRDALAFLDRTALAQLRLPSSSSSSSSSLSPSSCPRTPSTTPPRTSTYLLSIED